MSEWDRVPVVWGALDFAFVVWYVAATLWAGEVPLYSRLRGALEAGAMVGSAVPLMLAFLVTVLYLSLPISGILLYQRRTAGAVLALIQTPVRVILIVPSLFFLSWLSRLFPGDYAIVLGIVLVLASESLKLASLAAWWRGARLPA